MSSSHWQAFSEQAAAFLECCFAKSKEMGVKPVCWSFAIYYIKILPYKIKILFIIFLSETDRSNGYLTHTKNLRSPTKGLTKPPTLCYAASGIWQSLFTVNFINRMIGSGETGNPAPKGQAETLRQKDRARTTLRKSTAGRFSCHTPKVQPPQPA